MRAKLIWASVDSTDDNIKEYGLKIVIMLLVAVMGLSSCTTLNKNKLDTNKSVKKDDAKSPSLTAPKVNKVWVPEKIEGDKYIEGHYVWILEKTTSWSQ